MRRRYSPLLKLRRILVPSKLLHFLEGLPLRSSKPTILGEVEAGPELFKWKKPFEEKETSPILYCPVVKMGNFRRVTVWCSAIQIAVPNRGDRNWNEIGSLSVLTSHDSKL